MSPASTRRFITIPTVIVGLAVAYVLSLSAAVAKQRGVALAPPSSMIAPR